MGWPADNSPKTVRIYPGWGAAHAAEALAEAAGIGAWRVRLAIWLQGAATRIQAGEYRIPARVSPWRLARIAAEGRGISHRITIPEGLRTDEVLALLAKRTSIPRPEWERALRALVGEETEGVLLPETYTYRWPPQPKALLRAMIEAQAKVLDELAGDDADARRRLRIIASLIEKETAVPEERPLVAAVIYNRLKRGMPLQLDPSVIYGIIRTRGRFDGNLTRRDLRTDTPWNTYTRRGLPPTPICNPSKASLMAAAHPADVDYLYFVADGTGGHRFARTLEEHERNVRRWIRIEHHRR
ncbi:MAG: endolytic transglycosylase MltG [Zetaproteobacteria bacterium]|nr:MAG: endolytic transglycosylase MltG [Zetaproteobacteria bacterium]